MSVPEVTESRGARGEMLPPRPAAEVSLGMHTSAPVSPRRFPLLPPDVGWLPYVWLVYLPPLFIAPAQSGSARQWAATIAALIVFLAAYFRGYWLSGRRVLPMIAVQCALAVALAPWNVAAPSFFIYAASFAARAGRPRRAVEVIGVIVLVASATAFLAPRPF
ncbi:MAG TPA: hypothetical protein VFS20_29545, partial [Longimicrobium sp.]|nr:hypothetical protein [Longimicrobium sp.]